MVIHTSNCKWIFIGVTAFGVQLIKHSITSVGNVAYYTANQKHFIAATGHQPVCGCDRWWLAWNTRSW